MPRYVCDIEKLRESGKKIKDFSNDLFDVLGRLSNAGHTYMSAASWTSEAKDRFAATYERIGNYAVSNVALLQSLGFYTIAVADAIDDLEKNLVKIANQTDF